MVALRVDCEWSGTQVRGGGLTQLWFSNPSTDAQACVDAVEDFWTAMASAVSSSTTVRVLPTVPVFNETDGELLSVAGATVQPSIPGTAAGDALPAATQGLLRLVTSQVRNNRLIRGRIFIPAPVENFNLVTGQPNSTYTVDVNAAAAALVADATANWAVFSRPGGTGSTAGLIPQIITATCWSEWAVLRSRRD